MAARCEENSRRREKDNAEALGPRRIAEKAAGACRKCGKERT